MLEGKEVYGRRVAQSVLDQLAPEVKSLQAKAAHADLAKQQAAAADKARRDAELRFAQREKLLQVEREKVANEKSRFSKLQLLVANGGQALSEYQADIRAKLNVIRERQKQKGVER
jgi:hypothetical protein